jgi:hypothetical protein
MSDVNENKGKVASNNIIHDNQNPKNNTASKYIFIIKFL